MIFGILGYADVLHVLQIFDLPLINSIDTIRFLQFAWWLPWCLLLGAVITNVRHLRWYDAAVSLVLTAAYDWYFVLRFHDQLVADHLASYLSETKHAVILAGAIATAFAAGILVVRWTTPRVASLLMTSLVVASCLYYLPDQFLPSFSRLGRQCPPHSRNPVPTAAPTWRSSGQRNSRLLTTRFSSGDQSFQRRTATR